MIRNYEMKIHKHTSNEAKIYDTYLKKKKEDFITVSSVHIGIINMFVIWK